MNLGLIGFPLTHSFSKKYFEEKFLREHIQNVTYDLFPLQSIQELPLLISQHNLFGLNVTIPHKESVLKFCNHVSKEVEAIGATNCLKISDNKITAFNTDIIGFEKCIKPLLQLHHTSALILGTGGSSKAVQYVMKKLGIAASLVSREKIENGFTYTALNDSIVEAHTIIVNTTPAGMFPNIKAMPLIPYNAISHRHLVVDLIYNPAQTLFLHTAQTQGAVTKSGLEMLEIQAEESWKIWSE